MAGKVVKFLSKTRSKLKRSSHDDAWPSSTLTSGSSFKSAAASLKTSTVGLSKFVKRTRLTELLGSARKNSRTDENSTLAHRAFGNPKIPLLMAGTARLLSCLE